MTAITAGLHPRDGKWVPEAEECVETFGELREPEFRYIERLLGWPPARYKDWVEHRVFAPLTTAQADTVCAYLRSLAVAYDRETTVRWSP